MNDAAHSSCPLCQRPTADAIPIHTKHHPKGDVVLVQCRTCNLAFQINRAPDFDPDLYDYYRRRLEWPLERLHDPLNEGRYRDLLAGLAPRVPERSVLDVGCGVGHFIKVAGQQGWTARGIDLASGAIALCQRFHLPATATDFFSSDLDDARFGLICMFELIEHVSDPTAFIRRAADLLVPGGVLYLTTPNFASLDYRIQGADWAPIHPEHLLYFDPRTLGRLIETSGRGLTIDRIDCRNLSGTSVRRLLAPLKRRRSAPSGPTPQPQAAGENLSHIHEENAQERNLRARLEGSRGLRLLKRGINEVLNRTQTGNAMSVVCKKAS